MIAVSGSGIAGLAAALAVLRNQKPLLFIAGSAPASTHSGGVQIAPNGWAALDQLGIGPAARSLSTKLKSINVRNMNTGVTLVNLDLNSENYGSISRADLTKLLEAEILTTGSAERVAVNITHAVQRRASQHQNLDIVTDCGSVYQVEALIAADGPQGFGRKYINGPDSPVQAQNGTKRVAMRAVVKAENLPKTFSQPFCNLWLGAGAHLVHYPINGGEDVNLVLTLDETQAYDNWQKRYLGKNIILSEICECNSINWIKTTLSTVPYNDCWRRGRAVLAGDAAHPIPPNLAQGAGQSLVDAASLIHWLGANDIDHALSGYAQERSQAASKLFKKATFSSKIMAMSGPAATARSFAISLGGPQMLNAWLAEVWATA